MNDQPNPYDAVIADLRAKRDQIDQMIQSLELFKGGIPVLPPGMVPPPSLIGSAYAPPTDTTELNAGTFLGMGIEEAVKNLLRMRKRAMSAQEIATDLLAGGLHLKSETPANTIASVLSRAFNGGGDIVRISRGQWGIQEWYPTRRSDRRGDD